jgi:hypothetical protein
LWRACANNERDSQNHSACPASIREGELTSRFSPLPWQGSYLGESSPSPSPLQSERRPLTCGMSRRSRRFKMTIEQH